MNNRMDRRAFMRNCLGTAALASLGQLAINRMVFAEDMPLVTEDDPQAIALGYVTEASRTDAAKYPKYAAGQQCAQCIFFTGGEAATGPCGVFPGKSVNAGGWCSTWTKRV